MSNKSVSERINVLAEEKETKEQSLHTQSSQDINFTEVKTPTEEIFNEGIKIQIVATTAVPTRDGSKLETLKLTTYFIESYLRTRRSYFPCSDDQHTADSCIEPPTLQQIQDTLGSHNEHYNEPLRVLDGGNLFAISHSPTMSNRSKAIGENQSNTN